jgi:hypothetical protein
MAVDDEKDLALHPADQPPEEIAEHARIDPALHGHETKVAQRIDRREHVQPIACAGGLDHRRLAHRRPGRAGMMIGADARVVGEEDQRPLRLARAAICGYSSARQRSTSAGSCCQARYSGR